MFYYLLYYNYAIQDILQDHKATLREPISILRKTKIWGNEYTTIQNKPLKWMEWPNDGINDIEDLVDNDKI